MVNFAHPNIYEPTKSNKDRSFAYNHVQTPEQRKRNERFAKQQNAKRGKPAVEPKTKLEFKSPLNPIVAGLLAFIIIGGLAFELISRIFNS
ncbi:hypothetical protein Golomagni_00206 [Golovinomyces magnicellulatus]|nr:hypothetical protein Golomagni_00206 [Golovinomyces magnicellulatus]